MSRTSIATLFEERPPPSVARTIQERASQELVIALVGPVGSGVSHAATYFEEILKQEFTYEVAPIIKLSDIIRTEAPRVSRAAPNKDDLVAYVNSMQDIGNELRSKFGGDYLAEKVIERIVSFRKEKGGYSDKNVPVPGRRAYIIDSIKNKEELSLLKQVYGETFCLIGVFAPDHIRVRRLETAYAANKSAEEKNKKRDEIKAIINRDQGEIATFGQQTRNVFIESDLFIRNDKKAEELKRSISRYLNIVFNIGIYTPSISEIAMYEASAVSTNSACMSRQVGAAIVSAKGELISVGWNDVPKFGGGLYRESDQAVWDEATKSVQDQDNRCFKWGGLICHNEVRRNDILEVIGNLIASSQLVKKGTTKEDVRRLLIGTQVDSLTEFSRSIHAEMEAILTVAREGRHSLVGATLYCTTYPCHNCARHIVAAGISSVVYIHPYRKSLATVLHEDAVTEEPDDVRRVGFRQYDGVAPRNLLRLFQSRTERKKEGRLVVQKAQTAVPILTIPLDGPWDYESKIIADLATKEQGAK